MPAASLDAEVARLRAQEITHRGYSLRTWQSEVDFATVLLRIYDLFDKEWGKWEADEENVVKFESDEASAAFIKTFEPMAEALRDAESARKEFIKLEKR